MGDKGAFLERCHTWSLMVTGVRGVQMIPLANTDPGGGHRRPEWRGDVLKVEVIDNRPPGQKCPPFTSNDEFSLKSSTMAGDEWALSG